MKGANWIIVDGRPVCTNDDAPVIERKYEKPGDGVVVREGAGGELDDEEAENAEVPAGDFHEDVTNAQMTFDELAAAREKIREETFKERFIVAGFGTAVKLPLTSSAGTATRCEHDLPGGVGVFDGVIKGLHVLTVPENVLAEAARIVDGARQWSYGTPRDNHGRTAALWSDYLGFEVNARQVCMMNILQKISRDRHAAKRDNLVDIAGYARNAEMVEEQDAADVQK